jgi:Aspartyl protease
VSYHVVAAISFAAGLGLAAITGDEWSPPPHIEETGRQVIAAAKIDRGNRCKVPGLVDGVPLTFLVDTGAPRALEISADLLTKLGHRESDYEFTELWPGTRYGKIARANFGELRIGDFVLTRPEVWIYDRWNFSFGDTEPLLGLGALKNHGVRLEIEGDTCWLTVARSAGAG